MSSSPWIELEEPDEMKPYEFACWSCNVITHRRLAQVRGTSVVCEACAEGGASVD